jgi:hypothetical protein
MNLKKKKKMFSPPGTHSNLNLFAPNRLKRQIVKADRTKKRKRQIHNHHS